MMIRKKHVLRYLMAMLCCMTVAAFFSANVLTAFADELVPGSELECIYEYEYHPIHAALLMDSSGSIAADYVKAPSDPNLYSRDLAKVVTENLPMSPQNQVALFSYNTTCEMIKDFTALDSPAHITELNQALDSMTVTKGDTYMLNAVATAVQSLKKHHDPNARDVIIVFTDGAENQGINPDTVVVNDQFRSMMRERIQNVIGDSDVSVFAVGSDFLNGDTHSITGGSGETEGYGEVILKELTSSTGGTVLVTPNDIRELNGSFTKTVNQMCFREPTMVSVDDGKFHVGSSVVEVNIRVFSENEGNLKNVPLRLKKPDSAGGETITLDPSMQGENGILFFSDRLAANIKLLSPEEGDWVLDLSALPDKNHVEISMMEQYNIGMVTRCEQDQSKIQLGDTITIRTQLTSDGALVNDAALYQGVRARMFLCDNASEINASAISNDGFEAVMKKNGADYWDMDLDGTCFTKQIPLKAEGTQTLGVVLESSNFMTLMAKYTLTVGHTSLQLKYSIPAQTLVNGDPAVCCKSLHQYCNMENAVIQVKNADTNVVRAEILQDGDTLSLTPVAPGNCVVTLRFAESNGMSEQLMTFRVDVINATPKFIAQPEPIHVAIDHQIVLDDLSQYVEDYENDPLIFYIADIEKGGIVSAQIDNTNGGSLIVDGQYYGSTSIELAVEDGRGAGNSISIPVTVSRSLGGWVILLLIILAVAVGAIVIAGIIWLGSRKHNTPLSNLTIRFNTDQPVSITYTYNLPRRFRRGKECEKVSVGRVLQDALESAQGFADEDRRYICEKNGELYDKIRKALEAFYITGTPPLKRIDILEGSSEYIEVNGSRASVNMVLNRRSHKQTVSFLYVPADPMDLTRIEFCFSFGSGMAATENPNSLGTNPF